ncbi:MAG: type IX secretion system outer membrane channel protein PorV [Bacteroidales bacterium]|nr:type IX secretion system outer membrane channel protein PorV [Bacteroidales bacterium]MCF8454803.1 type IX secretion system outer membrane channel protein PorV [Bacteroidales bacterium]
MLRNLKVGLLIIGLGISFNLIGQNQQTSYGKYEEQVNTITTAVPFLMIAPDSRGGGMGDAGVAASPDENSMHYNPAKYAFIDQDMGVAISYTPWLRNLIDDINLLYLTGYKRIRKNQVVSGSLRYFSLGSITFTDINGSTIGNFNPNEFAVDVAYSRLLSRNLSGSIALRYIYSNLTGGQYVQGVQSHPGHAVSSDISIYYQNKLEVFKKDATFAFGANASNLGSKISYTENADKDFIPANLKLGVCLTTEIDEYNSLAVMFDVNKLLVPTQPQYIQGTDTIIAGKNPDVATATGIFQSFYDAPGGYKEEIKEINLSFGAEYWYAKQFALRAGYFHEANTKGNRKFFTVGMGLKLNVFGLDFSYLVPVSQRNPLENTLRFTLNFDFAGFSQQSNVSKSKVSSN